jgi:hypothetical protein
MQDDWYNGRDWERLMNLPEGILRRARERKEGPAYYKFSRRTIMYKREDLEHWYSTSYIPQRFPPTK